MPSSSSPTGAGAGSPGWSSPHWATLRDPLDAVLDLFDVTDRTAAIAEASARALLNVLGWNGEILRSSRLPARPGRSQRLADLASATGARAYLCGTGGMRYLDPVPFLAADITIAPFRTPAEGIWQAGREISALWALMRLGPRALSEETERLPAATAARAGSLSGQG